MNRRPFWHFTGLLVLGISCSCHGLLASPGWDGSLSIVVITNAGTTQRFLSLQRLLTSLLAADYSLLAIRSNISLHVSLDVEVLPVVLDYVQDFHWPYGTKSVFRRILPGGLICAVAESWFPTQPSDLGLLLEDDIEVSPLYYTWIYYAMSSYNAAPPEFRDKIVGLSLYTPRVVEVNVKKKYRLDPSELMKLITGDPRTPYLHQLPCSWGAVYFGRHWRMFLDYMNARLMQERDNPLVDPRSLSVKPPHASTPGWMASWKKFMVEMMYVNDWYMLYPSFPNQTSFSTNHLEAGEHIDQNDTNHLAEDFTVPLFLRSHLEILGVDFFTNLAPLDLLPKLDLLSTPLVSLDYLTYIQAANDRSNNGTLYHYWSMENDKAESVSVSSERSSGPQNLFWRRKRENVCKDFNEQTNNIFTSVNHQSGRLTIMIATFDRFDILQHLLDHYTRAPRVGLVLVTWNDLKRAVPPPMHVNNILVEFIPQDTDSLNNRFLPSMRITSDAVLILDDDMRVHLDDIELLYRAWEMNQNRIVGFFPRRIIDQKYNLDGADRWDSPYHVMLTKVMILHKRFLYMYSCGDLMLPVLKMVNEAMNCEDLAMNFVVSSVTNQSAPLFVEPIHFVGDFGDSRFSSRDGVGKGIHQVSKGKKGVFLEMNHIDARSYCVKFLSKHFGFDNGLPPQNKRIATKSKISDKTAEARIVTVGNDFKSKIGCVDTFGIVCGLDVNLTLGKWIRFLPNEVKALKMTSADSACNLASNAEWGNSSIKIVLCDLSDNASMVSSNVSCIPAITTSRRKEDFLARRSKYRLNKEGSLPSYHFISLILITFGIVLCGFRRSWWQRVFCMKKKHKEG